MEVKHCGGVMEDGPTLYNPPPPADTHWTLSRLFRIAAELYERKSLRPMTIPEVAALNLAYGGRNGALENMRQHVRFSTQLGNTDDAREMLAAIAILQPLLHDPIDGD